MRDILVTALVFGAIPFILMRPHIGILVWSWLGYMSPHRLTWGFAYAMPFAQIVAIAVLISAFINKKDLKFYWYREQTVLLLFSFWMQISTFFALHPEFAWEQWNKVWKIQLMTFFTIFLINDKKKLHMLIWVIALSLGFYGVKGGIFTIQTGGGGRVWGPAGSFIAGNNELGLALVMTVPLMFYLYLTLKKQWLKVGMFGAIALTCLAILGTQSRGAFLGIAAMLAYLVLKSQKKFLYGIIFVVLAFSAFNFMPEKWHDRIDSIANYEEDSSAMGRLNSWQFAINIALARPLTGAGFEGFTPQLFYQYAPDPLDFHDAHSIYFEVLGEQGFVGLFLFLLLAIFTYQSAKKCVKQTNGIAELNNLNHLMRMVQVSIIGYLVSGAFLGLAYFDFYYHLVAIVIISKYLVAEHLSRPQEEKPTIPGGMSSEEMDKLISDYKFR